MNKEFTTYLTMDEAHYAQYVKDISRKQVYLSMLKLSLFCLFILLLALSEDATHIAIVFGFFMFALPIAQFIGIKRALKKQFQSDRMNQNATFHYQFYLDKLEIKHDYGLALIPYELFHDILIKDKYIYFMTSKKQAYMIDITKCSVQLLDFIRSIQRKKI